MSSSGEGDGPEVTPEKQNIITIRNVKGPAKDHKINIHYQGTKIFTILQYLLSFYFPYIHNVNEKLPVSKFPYFGKYIIQLFGYC